MKFRAETVDLAEVEFTPELLRCIPSEVVHKYRVLPVFDWQRTLWIALAVADAEDVILIETLAQILFGRELVIEVADRHQLNIYIRRLYGEPPLPDLPIIRPT